ncbi:MAG: 4-oxalomesaconate tautomerase [Woeseia sp.]
MQTAIPCSVMRGGTSKGLYFQNADLPAERGLRDQVLLAAMGSPDARQIDGMGGAHPLTSKVAVISRSDAGDADVDYLFLQVVVDRADVSDNQNCGNILAGVAPFAIDEGLVSPGEETTDVRIRMVNTGGIAVARVRTAGGRVTYAGDASIDGVPRTAAPVLLEFLDIAGSSCGALLPTGQPVDVIDDLAVTCIDNGMPVVLLRAADLGKTGYESPAELEGDSDLKERIEEIRLQAGELMQLGDVTNKTVPKMCLVAPARNGGAIATRTFIPHRVHEAIGVLGSVSVATACLLPGSVAQSMSGTESGRGMRRLDVEHPTGFFTVEVELDASQEPPSVLRSALLRTARLLMRGTVFVPAAIWSGRA